jgi:hypothetical protein
VSDHDPQQPMIRVRAETVKMDGWFVSKGKPYWSIEVLNDAHEILDSEVTDGGYRSVTRKVRKLRQRYPWATLISDPHGAMV